MFVNVLRGRVPQQSDPGEVCDANDPRFRGKSSAPSSVFKYMQTKEVMSSSISSALGYLGSSLNVFGAACAPGLFRRIESEYGLQFEKFFQASLAPLPAVSRLLVSPERAAEVKTRAINVNIPGADSFRHTTRTFKIAGSDKS
jgi:hypothetical protein